MEQTSWLGRTQVSHPLLNFLSERASILLLLLDNRGNILHVNTFTEQTVGRSPIGEPFKNILIDFDRTFQLSKIPYDSVDPTRLHVSRMPNPPETYDFFFSRTEHAETLVIGQQDMGEVEQLRYNMISLNKDLGQLTRKLHRNNKQLELLHAQKNQFFGMAVHDLRHPLTVIKMYTDFLLQFIEEGVTENGMDFLNIISSSSTHMEQILNDFLEFSVFESGQLKIEKKTTELVAWLNEIIERNRPVAGSKQITLHLETTVTALERAIDSSKMMQVIENLINNACKFSPEHTKVIIRLEQTATEVVISVVDHGPGIPADQQERLFDPFQRTNTSQAQEQKGSGLGLAIVRKIVEAHGGKVWVESQPGEGALFGIVLPFA